MEIISAVLFLILIVASLIVNIVYVSDQVEEFERGQKIFHVAFYPQISIWNNLLDRLNKAGLILVEIVATPLCLINNICIFFFFCCEKICVWLWKKYTWIFRRRDNNE